MTVKEYHSIQELLNLAKSESNSRLARRIQAVQDRKRRHTSASGPGGPTSRGPEDERQEKRPQRNT